MSIRILHTPVEEAIPAPSHVTIGVFDGVHRGHQRLIGLMTEMAHAANRLSAVMTFDPHPGTVLGQRTVPTLSTIDERAAFLDEIEVDLLVVLRFTMDVAQTPAMHFVEMLRRDLQMVELWMGPDFALGRRREGDAEFLQRVGRRQGFTVEIVPPLEWRGKVVSSSRIRSALAAGDLEEASGCLGRPYSMTGRMVSAQSAGQATEHPAIDVELPPGRLLPAPGVYVGGASMVTEDISPALVDVPNQIPGAPHPSAVEVYLTGGTPPLSAQKMGIHFIERLGKIKP